VVGLDLDPAHAARIVDRGPAADDAAAAAAFRAFWGDKAELRRFKDGSIVEAVRPSTRLLQLEDFNMKTSTWDRSASREPGRGTRKNKRTFITHELCPHRLTSSHLCAPPITIIRLLCPPHGKVLWRDGSSGGANANASAVVESVARFALARHAPSCANPSKHRPGAAGAAGGGAGRALGSAGRALGSAGRALRAVHFVGSQLQDRLLAMAVDPTAAAPPAGAAAGDQGECPPASPTPCFFATF
jgi:hypothetical protein